MIIKTELVLGLKCRMRCDVTISFLSGCFLVKHVVVTGDIFLVGQRLVQDKTYFIGVLRWI